MDLQFAPEYADDLSTAKEADLLVSRTWFNHLFRVAPELSTIGIASGKENFGRCTTCGNLEEAIRSARARGDAQTMLSKKQERLDHIMKERADKLAYYSFRYDPVSRP
eukprot:6199493-Pleurochrysis_carterae.AAC.1